MTETELKTDEQRVLSAYRLIKARGHGEMAVAVRHGQIVKLWTTDKWDLEDELKGKLKEGTL